MIKERKRKTKNVIYKGMKENEKNKKDKKI